MATKLYWKPPHAMSSTAGETETTETAGEDDLHFIITSLILLFSFSLIIPTLTMAQIFVEEELRWLLLF